jgi:LPXTG-motif cell wall-anchored protein
LSVKADKPQVPLTSYPSTGGVNLMLILLILLAAGLGIAYGARRWRRSRAQAS